MSNESVMEAIAPLARWQSGMFTTAQARQLGIHNTNLARFEDRGIIEREQHGVYRIAGAPDNPQWDQTYAAWLSLDPTRTADERAMLPSTGQIVVAGPTALRAHGIDLYDQGRIHFISQRRRQSRSPAVHHRQRDLTHLDLEWINGMPTLGLADTFADTAALVPDLSILAEAVQMGLDNKMTITVDELVDAIQRHPRTRVTPALIDTFTSILEHV